MKTSKLSEMIELSEGSMVATKKRHGIEPSQNNYRDEWTRAVRGKADRANSKKEQKAWKDITDNVGDKEKVDKAGDKFQKIGNKSDASKKKTKARLFKDEKVNEGDNLQGGFKSFLIDKYKEKTIE